MKRHSAPRRATKAGPDIAGLMFELGRVRGEEDIRGVLQNLLRVVEAGLYRLEVAAGRGFADMVCHEYRIVIETKSRNGDGTDAHGAGLAH